ncbi:MAG: RHS repeat-associated core domain-containing protein, partial [Candidatus Electrothrix sp. ATG1]|nr:RHS repeat-associated core domain-containing protein [Candidatus Electrothrix sp. ATG1]
GGQNYSYLYDGKGNVDGLIDDAEVMVAGYVYSPFGNLLTRTGSLDQPFRFSTKAFDEQTGLAYYGYRFYSPSVGRWINRDPIGEAGGINLYGFVQNNPIIFWDPFGLLNPSKGVSSLGNAVNAGRLYAGGMLKLGAAAGLTSTGVGAPVGGGIGILGAWNLWSAQSAWNRSRQQWNEAWNESWSNASWRNLLGVLPFGTEFDDPCEPSIGDVLKNKWKNFKNKPFEIIKEIGTLGF